MSSILKVCDVTKIYGSKSKLTRAVNGVSFSVEKGEFLGVMGASGSGKTTLLNCVSTIDRPTTGEIMIENQALSKLKGRALSKFRRDALGFIFQDFNLLDTLTGYENIAMALSIQNVGVKEIQERVDLISKKLNIHSILKQYPHEMSGGEKQRIAAARAMITRPYLILADEPTGALDSKSAKQLLDSFALLNADYKATILMVTHDAFTASYCDRIVFIKDGEIFTELIKGDQDRKTFFSRIIEVLTLLGGDLNHVY